MKTTILKTILPGVCWLLVFATPARAQEANGPGGAGDVEGNPDQTPVPIDGGLALLLAAGAAYGLKKYRSASTNRDEASPNEKSN